MAEQNEDRIRAMIEERAKSEGYPIVEWETDEDGHLRASIGRFRVIEEDEAHGLYADDEGVVTLSVVGAPQYGNERVAFMFTPEGSDYGEEVRDFYALEGI